MTIVFLHSDGRYQIIGHTPDEPPKTLPLPGMPSMVLLGREVERASLVKVTKRAAIYKEQQ